MRTTFIVAARSGYTIVDDETSTSIHLFNMRLASSRAEIIFAHDGKVFRERRNNRFGLLVQVAMWKKH
jgi:hypothetical protein